VKPAEDIQNLRGQAVKRGFEDRPGAKKLKHFVDWIYATGQINRLYLPEEVYGNREAREKLTKAYQDMGVEVWEVPKPVKGLMKFRDIYLQILSKEDKALEIDFSHVRRIDRMVGEIFKADICTVLDRVHERGKKSKGLIAKLKGLLGGE
jgi:succinate dehydrogenase / fumarate reductase iron-sulfur subunit